MTDLNVTQARLFEGVWEGMLTGVSDDRPPEDAPPSIEVTHRRTTLPGVEVIAAEGHEGWLLRVPVPPQTLSDGVQTYLIRDAQSGRNLASFAILAGDVLGDDIRAEVALLRDELELLKRAFRQHCLETM